MLWHSHRMRCATWQCTAVALPGLGLCAVQVRRYVYCDVVRAMDIGPHIDTAGVQCYIINQAKVMFLNPRPQSKPGKLGAPDTCRTCRRHLREGYSYCSLSCKVCVRVRVRGAARGLPPAGQYLPGPCAPVKWNATCSGCAHVH